MTRRALTVAILLVSYCVSAMGQLVVTPEDDADTLANELLGDGITIVGGSPSFTGASATVDPFRGSAGIFSGGLSAGIGMEAGIILMTGDVTTAVGPNALDNTMWIHSQLTGDADLDALLGAPPLTTETTALEMQFETQSGDVSFNFVFASEEYNEYVYTGVNDVFGLFVDGENIALVPGTDTYVSVNTVNGGGGYFDGVPYGTGASNPQHYNNNDLSDGGPFFNIEYDGFTNVFTAQKSGLGPGPHTLKLAIADVGDKVVDSAVFIQADSLTDAIYDAPVPSLTPLGLLVLLGLFVLVSWQTGKRSRFS